MTKINRHKLVYTTLRNRIFNGFYLPRQRLTETSLADELNVSRTIIRDVLKQLAMENFVTIEAYKGSFVSDISAKNLSEYFQVEAILESAAAALACSRLKSEQIEQLEKILDDSKKIESLDAKLWGEYNRRFHKLINTSCGNDKLIKLIRDNVTFLNYWYITLSNPMEIAHRNQDHDDILAALKERNADKVRRLMENHVRNAFEALIGRLQEAFKFFEGAK